MKAPAYYEDVNNGLIKGMLKRFYSAGSQSRSKESAMLQVGFLVVRYAKLKRAMKQHNAIMDSNLISDYIMATNLLERGEMSQEDYNVYLELNQEMQAEVNGSPWNGYPELILYLDISPEHELEEIAKRGRAMEDIRKDKKLVEYYHSVNDAYSNWYKGFYQAQVLRIDRDKYDFVNNLEDRYVVLKMIYDKMYEIGSLEKDEYDLLTEANFKNNHLVAMNQKDKDNDKIIPMDKQA